MYGKAGGGSQGNLQANINVDNEDAQHSFDLSQLDTSGSMPIADVSVKMVEGGGTKLIFAKNVLDKWVMDLYERLYIRVSPMFTRVDQANKSQRSSSKDPSSRKSKKFKGSKSSGMPSTGATDDSTNDSQSAAMMDNMDGNRPPTPPPIVHVSKMPFIPPIKSSSSSPPVNLTYTPKSSGTLKTTLSHTGSRRKSSTTPTNPANNTLKQSQSYISSTPTNNFRQQPTSTPLSSGPLGTMFSFPPTTPTTPTPSSGARGDYLDKRARTVQRRRIDPLVSFATLLEGILNELRDMPEVSTQH